MDGPWDDFAQAGTSDDTGPWTDFQQQDDSGPWTDFQPESSQLGAFARGAAHSAVPTVGGALAGARAGALIGSAFEPGLGTTIGAIGGGLAAGIGAGSLLELGEDKLLDALGWRNKAQEQADQEQHPTARALGEMAPAALALHPSGTMAQRALGAGIGAVGTAGSQLINEGSIDPASIAEGAAMGAAFPRFNKLGEAAMNYRLPNYRGGNTPPPATPPAGETTVQHSADEIEFVPPNGMADASNDQEASQGKGAPSTPEAVNVANDVTTVAPGIAMDNPKVPVVIGTGQVVGAAGDRYQAHGPEDYRKAAVKDALKTFGANDNEPQQESVKLDQNDIAQDIAGALKPEEPQSTFQQQTIQRPPAYQHLNLEPVPRNTPEEIANLTRGLGNDDARLGTGNFSPEPTKPQEQPPTPEQQQLIAHMRDALDQRVQDPETKQQALAAYDAMSPSEQLAAAMRAQGMGEALNTEDKTVTNQGEVRATFKRATLENGKQASSKAAAARKQGSIEAIVAAVQEHSKPDIDGVIPTSVKDKTALVARLKQMVDTAKNNYIAKKIPGAFKTDLKDVLGYRPKKVADRAPEHAVYDAALQVIEKQTPAKIKKYFDAVKALKPDNEGEINKLAAQQKEDPIDKEVFNTPQLTEAGAEAQLDKKLPGSGVSRSARVEFENDRTEAPDSDYNRLVDYVNSRGAKEYSALEDHFDLRAEMDQPAEPAELLDQMQKVLQGGRGFVTKKPITSREDLGIPEVTDTGRFKPTPLEPGTVKANEGIKSLKESDPERYKLLAAEAAAKYGTQATPEERAAALNKINQRIAEAKNHGREPIDTEAPPKKPLPGSYAGVKDLLAQFAGNESGSVKIPFGLDEDRPVKMAVTPAEKRFFDEFSKPAYGLTDDVPSFKYNGTHVSMSAKDIGAFDDWVTQSREHGIRLPPKFYGLFRDRLTRFISDESGTVKVPKWLSGMFAEQPHDPTSPRRNDAAKNLIQDMPSWIKDYTNRLTTQKAETAAATIKAAASELPITDLEKINLAHQHKTEASLPGKLRDFGKEIIEPMQAALAKVYQEVYDLNKKYGFGLSEKQLPAAHNGFAVRYVPRLKLDDPNAVANAPSVDPVTGRSLGLWQPTVQPRDFKALYDTATGDRFIMREDDKGNYQVLRPGTAATTIKNLPPGFEANIGDTVPLRIGGKTRTMTVDHAATDEIEKATAGNVKYERDPVTAIANSLTQLQTLKANMELIHDIKSDPRWADITTTDEKIADAKGFAKEPTTLKELATRGGKTVYMPRNLKWIFDDFHKSGLGIDDANWLRTTGVGLARIFLTFGSPIHVANVATQAAIQRGFDTVTPKNIQAMGPLSVRAWKAVMDPANNKDYGDFLKDGGRPQFINSYTADLIPGIAKRMGADTAQQPSKWSAAAKIWGVSVPDMALAVEKYSKDHMWKMTDMMGVMRYLENKEVKGMSGREAAAEVHEFQPSYDLPTTIGPDNSPFANTVGRLFQRILADPTVSLFGRYHMDLWRSFAHVTRNTISPNATKEERLKAVGQLMAGAAMAYIVFPALDKVAQVVSGNENAEMRRRGMLAITDAATGYRGPLAKPGDTSYANLANNIFTPSVPISLARHVLSNTAFNGKSIVQKMPLTPKNVAKGAAEAGDYALQNTIAPYGNIAAAAEKPGATLPGVAGRFAAGMVGMHLPTDREMKYRSNEPKYEAREDKARAKSPGGPLESFVRGFAKGGEVTAPVTSDIQRIIVQGTQLAMRRPIVLTPMPSGANSSKNLNGPIYVDPSVPERLRRPVAVHETVEQMLMAQGMKYAQAHEIATRAEMAAVARAGMDPQRYDHEWDGLLDHIEKQPYNPARAPRDMHVDPEQAIGHYARRVNA